MNKIKSLLNNNLIVRYAISGGSASAVDILLFTFLYKVLLLHYLLASVISVTISFFLRFYLQKVFAFRHTGQDIHRQLFVYGILYLVSIGFTTLMLRILIGELHMWFILAQVITILFVAGISFLVYKHLIFTQKNER